MPTFEREPVFRLAQFAEYSNWPPRILVKLYVSPTVNPPPTSTRLEDGPTGMRSEPPTFQTSGPVTPVSVGYGS